MLAELRALEHAAESTSDDGSLTQFDYDHPVTGVYCLFDLCAEVATGTDGLQLPDGFAEAGLSVSVNFLRPSFFAHEVMPIITEIAARSLLWLYDAQADTMHAPGTAASVLIDSWVKHNEKVTHGVARDKEPIRKPYLPPARSFYWWQYTKKREDLQARLGDNIFVPSILLTSDPGDRVRLTVVWSAEVRSTALSRKQTIPLAQVFPECDYLMLAWGSEGDQKLKTRYVSFDDAMARLAQFLDPLEGPVPSLMVLPPERQVQATATFESIPSLQIGQLTRIAPDAFVDVHPDEDNHPSALRDSRGE